MGRNLRRAGAAAAAVLAVGAGLAATPSPALATSGHGWDGKSPTGTTCAGDARTMKTAYFKTRAGTKVGRIELRYSVRCHTAWARLYNYRHHVAGDSYSGEGWIHRNSDGRQYTCWSPNGTNTVCITKMVYDKSPITSYAAGEIDDYPNSYDLLKAKTGSY